MTMSSPRCGPPIAVFERSPRFRYRRIRTTTSAPAALPGGYSRIPRYLIARLAIDTSPRGQGYGEQLLLDALGTAVAASEIGGDRLVVVDAIDDETQSFYEHYHFVPVMKRERRLVMKDRRRRGGDASAPGRLTFWCIGPWRSCRAP